MQRISYDRHRFPPEVIRHAIWLYLRFTLSYRDVEELLIERGIEVSYETVRRWVLKFGPSFARNLRRLRPRPADGPQRKMKSARRTCLTVDRAKVRTLMENAATLGFIDKTVQ